MATEKLRAELELITSKAEKDLKRFDRSLASVERRVTSMGGKGGKSLRPLGEGLSAATVNANEFEKSMAAANARVIAFGASAGLIIQVQRALKETVRATVEVEKSLTDINVVLGAGAKDLAAFGNQLFKVAAQTGQSFKTIAAGATELARQGLGTEKTLKRLNDAMILSRLTGMGAEEAVSSLTAAVNSFNKAGITSAQVVNKMAKVDQAFAVSSDDLAKAISRVGSSAVDAGVSMDELLAITTAVQQRTARGGAVIGNAFKTIFTRIGRTDVQKKLANIGVATRDMQGQMLPATKVLENLAGRFDKLSQSQQNQLAESVAGVFQVNILRSALGDLSSKYGVYNRALRESASATNEAYLKNEQLNQTLSALVNKTLANLTQAGAAIGGATLKPAIENVLSLVNSAIGAFGEGGRFEEFGKGIGKDILKGVGSFISGPGLVLLTAGLGKLTFSFAKFAGEALKGFADIGKQAANRKALEATITAELQRQPAILKQIQSGELSAAAAAKDMLAAMKATNLEATKLAVTSRSIASSMVAFPGGRRPGRAQGFVPNFADPNAERASAAMGGYKAGAIKSMNIPGQGSVMYNGAETVKQFPGMQQPAIMPPQRSLAGANYKKSFGAAHGFDPYAAGGFVPNFNLGVTRATANMNLDDAITAGLSRSQLSKGFGKGAVDARLGMVSAGGKPVTKGVDKFKDAFDARGQIGIVSLTGGSNPNAKVSTSIGQLKAFKPYLSSLAPAARKKAEAEPVAFRGIQVSSLDVLRKNLKSKGRDSFNFSREINQELIDPLARIGARAVGGVLGNQADKVSDIKRTMGGKRLLPTGTEGELFEKAMQLALHSKTRFMQAIRGTDNAPFDFEEAGSPTKKFKDTLGFSPMLQRADAKRTASSGALRSLIKKSYNQGILIEAGLAKGPLFKEGGALPFMGRMSAGNIRTAAGKLRGTVGAAGGLVPNFSPLTDAITRERAAGVPKSAIRVGSSPALKSSGNPGGLGVYNTIHEPGGLGQGISRSRSMGINPKSHGVPNFVSYSDPAKFGGVPTTPSGKIIIESPEEKDNTEATKKDTEATKESTKETRKTRSAMNRLRAGLGRAATPLGLVASTAGYMMAPAIGRKTGMDEGGIMGGITGATMGAMGAGALLAPFTGGLSLAAATALAGGVGGFAGYQMGKADPTEKALQELEADLQKTLGANADFKNAMSAMAQDAMNLRELIKDGVITEGQLNERRRQLEALVIQAIKKGKGVEGFGDPELIRRIMNEQLLGEQEGMGALQESMLLSEGRAQSTMARGSLDAILQDEMFRTKLVRKRGLFPGGSAEAPFALPDKRPESALERETRLTEEFAGQVGTGGKFRKDSMGAKYMGAIDTLFGALTDVEGAGVAGLTRQQIVAEGFKNVPGGVGSKPGAYFTQDLQGVMAKLLKDGKITQEFFNMIFGRNVPKILKDQLAEQLRLQISDQRVGKDIIANTQIQVKQQKDFTEANKKMLNSILDRNIDLIRNNAILNQQRTMIGARANTAQTVAATQFRSAGSLAGIRGGDAAGLDFQLNNLGDFLDKKFGIAETELSQQRELATRSMFNSLRGSQLQGLKSTFGIGGDKGATVQGKSGAFKALENELSGINTLRGAFDAGMIGEEGVAGKLRGSIGRLQTVSQDRQLTQGQTKALNSYITSLLKYVEDLERNNQKVNSLTELKDLERRVTEENIKAQKEELEARKRFQKDAYLTALRDRQLMADTTVEGLTQLRASGVGITGAQIAAAKQEARRSTIAGGGKANSIEGFTESFRYNSADAAFAIDDAMTELGASIKDSTKTAIQDIASGASSFKEAFGSIMASIADNIANRGIDMGVDTLFGFLAKSKGGPIPRGYNQGGVVTGGSGVRDDVMTFMQGGEYVIKKSSAQKIGYSTLNAINGYASGGKARVSLAKDFMYTGDDPTRPTGGGFSMGRGLSTRALFRDDDPQTGRIFKRQETLASYLEYRRAEQARRDAAIQKVKDQKKARLTKAYIGAAGNILGGMAASGAFSGGNPATVAGPDGVTMHRNVGSGGTFYSQSGAAGDFPSSVFGMNRGGSPALVQGGEYIMSPRTTAKYGTGFMGELNRGRMPGFNMGGPVGGGGGAGGGITTNNVNLAINVDKSGQTSVQTEQTSGGGKDKEREDKSEIERQKQMGEAIRGVVLKEIERQQRPGGLLRDNASYSGGRRI